MRNHKSRMGAPAAALLSAAALAMLATGQAAALAQSETVAPGSVSGPTSRAPSGASREVLLSLNLAGVLNEPRARHLARFDASRGAGPDRRTPAKRAQLGNYLISTRRASTRFVPLAASTPRGAVYLAQQAAPSLGRSNAAARLGEALVFYRQLAFNARLSADDIADAMTLDALLSYSAATGRALDILSDNSNRLPRDEALLRAVRDQMRNIVRHDAELQGMDAPQKRFVAEMHQMLAAISALPPSSTGSPAFRAQAQSKYQRDARQIFKFATGHEAGQVRLSSSGFAPAPSGGR